MEFPSDWPSDARRDRLIGNWHIYQRTGGHRTSTDDLITAWYAVHRTTRATTGATTRPSTRPSTRLTNYLDLGCGIGSVLLMVSHRLRPQTALGIEAQAQSVMMARRSLAELPEAATTATTIQVDQADFRDVDFGDTRFDLITGSPPYFPTEAGVLPADAQRRACRFEERGGIESYLTAAAAALSATGRFYVVFQTAAEARVLAAAAAAGVHLSGCACFRMASDRPKPFLTVYEFARGATANVHRFECAVRDADRQITEQYVAIRRELGVEDQP